MKRGKKSQIKPDKENGKLEKETHNSSSGISTPDGSVACKQANMKHIRKHGFTHRVSLLDDLEPQSELRKNKLVGFYNMLYVISFYYFIITPLMCYKENGYWMETKLYQRLERDLLMCLVTWPMFYAWSHIALLIQYLLLKDVPEIFIFILQHSSQTVMFIYTHYLVMTRDWQLPQGAFVTFQSCVFFMKMHSYTMTNYKMKREWVEAGKPKTKLEHEYPNNISFKNFTIFFLTPVIVYEPIYPRTEKIRWWYLAIKTINFLSMLMMSYMITSDHILPVIENVRNMSFLDSIFLMTLPMSFLCLVIFNMVWEQYCNFWAEVTRFGDRLFYTDWWNSTDFEEFNRNWNRPVYEFLYRHVYLELIFEYGFTVRKAQFITFLFSAVLHEYTLCLSMKQLTPIMIMFMMLQVPLMIWTRKIKGTKVGNLFFWWGIVQGLPLILNLYLRFEELSSLLIL